MSRARITSRSQVREEESRTGAIRKQAEKRVREEWEAAVRNRVAEEVRRDVEEEIREAHRAVVGESVR